MDKDKEIEKLRELLAVSCEILHELKYIYPTRECQGDDFDDLCHWYYHKTNRGEPRK